MDNTLYTPEVRNYVMSRPWPLGLRFDIVEYAHHLAIRFYSDNYNSFDGETKLHIAMLIKEVIEKVRADGIPFYMEKAEGTSG